MYGFSFVEDEYWERVRERIENPPRHPWDDPPEPEEVQYNDQFYCLDYTYREDEDY